MIPLSGRLHQGHPVKLSLRRQEKYGKVFFKRYWFGNRPELDANLLNIAKIF
jgi:hypothetical protein